MKLVDIGHLKGREGQAFRVGSKPAARVNYRKISKMTSLYQQIKTHHKESRILRDSFRSSLLSVLLGDLYFLAKNAGKDEPTDEEAIKRISKMISDASATVDLIKDVVKISELRKEIEILTPYIPVVEMLPYKELREEILGVALTEQDTKKVLGKVMKHFKGRKDVDMKTVQEIVKLITESESFRTLMFSEPLPYVKPDIQETHANLGKGELPFEPRGAMAELDYTQALQNISKEEITGYLGKVVERKVSEAAFIVESWKSHEEGDIAIISFVILDTEQGRTFKKILDEKLPVRLTADIVASLNPEKPEEFSSMYIVPRD